MKIVGIDPGGTTGVTILAKYEDNWVVSHMWDGQDLSGLGKFLGNLMGHEMYFVMESAVPHGRITKGKMLQMQAMGAVKSAVPFRLHEVSPEERSRVKKVPKSCRGLSDHIKDAYRVAVAYGLKEGLMTLNDADNLSSDN